MDISDKSKVVEFVAIRCKELRKSKPLSQHELTVDTGINIGRLELGTQDVSITTILRLTMYFGLSISEFFHGFDFGKRTNLSTSNNSKLHQ